MLSTEKSTDLPEPSPKNWRQEAVLVCQVFGDRKEEEISEPQARVILRLVIDVAWKLP